MIGNKMEYKSTDDVNGTCLQGRINTSYQTLLDKLPPPKDYYDDYKSDVEWSLKFSDGTIATVYNWKNGKNYLGEDGLELEEITEWNIGGHTKKALEYINQLLSK